MSRHSHVTKPFKCVNKFIRVIIIILITINKIIILKSFIARFNLPSDVDYLFLL